MLINVTEPYAVDNEMNYSTLCRYEMPRTGRLSWVYIQLAY
jgi:hypothetical protein